MPLGCGRVHNGSRHVESQLTEQPGRYEQTLNVRREDLSGTYPALVESPEDAEVEAGGYFVFRYCPVCRSEFVAEDGRRPPYSWVHDQKTGEHRLPGQRAISKDND